MARVAAFLDGLTFAERIGLALAFLAVVSGVELVARGRRATRWRGSLVLVACGVCGASVAAAIDLLTSSLGPAYFAVGKGLGDAPGLTGRALRLGARAGVGAGVVAGAVLLLVARRPLRSREVALASVAIAVATAGGLGVGLVVGALVPAQLVVDAGFALAPPDRRGFALAWGGHLGAYAGALVGLVAHARRLARRRAAEREG